MEVLKTENLTKYYGKSRGIINVCLSVEAGECFGFIGPNGAGKSTTIRTLLGLISATSGSAYIFGKDIVKEKEMILRDIGYLPSEAVFCSGMKVREILKLSADLRKKDCSAEALKLCERLQIDTEKKVDELSFGNRKKVAIVCALQSEPELLILDEPTGGLDPLMQHEFFDIIKERNSKGVTVFLSSHILAEVQRNCTRAAIIREGRIIACDNVDTLAKSNAKRVSVSGALALEGLDGVKNVTIAENRTSFLYSGDINRLIKTLSNVELADLTITEPDLDEVFLHYYEKEATE